jgi:hypothetical protein
MSGTYKVSAALTLEVIMKYWISISSEALAEGMNVQPQILVKVTSF